MHIKSRLFLLFLTFFLFACDNSLSDREAIKLIEEKGGYPRLKETNFDVIKIQSPLGAEIKRLVNEGYLIPRYKVFGNDEPPTEKGKEIVKSAFWNPMWNAWQDVYSIHAQN